MCHPVYVFASEPLGKDCRCYYCLQFVKYQGLLFPFVLEQNKERNTCTRTTVMEVRGKRQKHFKLLMFTLNGHLFEPQGFRYHKQTCHFK